MKLRDRIKQGLFLLDGAMGTQFIARGIELGKCNDCLNIDSSDIVFDIHKSYFDAGSDAVITNTFGANRYALSKHGFGGLVEKINIEGAKLARRAAGDKRYVLGDIGPSGGFLAPLGDLEPEKLRDIFCEQANALLAGGVDGFIIETMTALDELAIAIKAVKSICDLPVFASMAFDKAGADFRTMMGVDVKSAVSIMVALGVDAVGFNCGTISLNEYVELAEKYVSVIKVLEKERAMSDERRVTIFAEPNAGKPELIDGKAIYKILPDDFAVAVEKIYSAGVKIIGGCCGTSPQHIKALAEKLKS
ncbi:MAG: homocysteine S-methyltransferase family protein [Planctomycetes bacterium]|nr:homocysteine S-methyltransferase family protein [Planctomycetota bacterium]